MKTKALVDGRWTLAFRDEESLCYIAILLKAQNTNGFSYKALNHSDQVHDSCSAHVRHGYSKAQMCLKKILGIVSSIPVPQEPETGSFCGWYPKLRPRLVGVFGREWKPKS